jgi:predicted ATPase with chaperone activity
MLASRPQGRQDSEGKCALAHHGALCLDGFPGFRRHVLEVLRPLIEEGASRYDLQSVLARSDAAGFAARLMTIRGSGR